MFVRFCVLPTPLAKEIEAIAREFAAMDPNARRVVVPGDEDYPDALIPGAIADIAKPGAVVLGRSGNVFRVLDADDARNGGIVDLVFSQARFA